MQLTDILDHGLNDLDYLQDTLSSMKEKLEDQAVVPTDEVKKKEALQNLRNIAYDEDLDPDVTIKALRESIMLHHESESTIKTFRERISDLEPQISFYIESGKNAGNEGCGADYVDGGGSSSIFSAIPSSIRSARFDSRSTGGSEQARKYYKPHSSIDAANGEQFDPYALRQSLCQEIEAKFNEQISQLKTDLSEAKSKEEIASSQKLVISNKFDKAKADYDKLEKKYGKLLIAYKKDEAKIEELEKQLKMAKSKIFKLTNGKEGINFSEDEDKIKVLMAEIESAKTKITQQSSDLSGAKSEASAAKEKATKAEAELAKYKQAINNIKKQLGTSKKENEKAIQKQNELQKSADEYKAENDQLRTQIANSVQERSVSIDLLPDDDNEGQETENNETRLANYIQKTRDRNKELEATIEKSLYT